MLLIGHRGCAYPGYNQNTIRAFRHVIEQGVSAIEFDVQKTSDGALVIVHNLDLSQVSTGTGLLSKKPLKEISMLWAGDPARGEDRIPLLDELFSLIESYSPFCRPVMHLELKGDGTGRPAGELVRLWIDSGRLRAEDFLISSFNWDEIKMINAVCPDLKVALLDGAIRRKDLLKKSHEAEPFFSAVFAYGEEDYMLPRSKSLQDNLKLLEQICPQPDIREILRVEIENALGGAYYTDSLLKSAKEFDAYSLNLWYQTVKADFVRKAHDVGLKVFVFTVNQPDDLSRMYHIGVDGVFTDVYQHAQEFIEKLTRS